jgi:RimJ/RimL family protein N-acetyltransferase
MGFTEFGVRRVTAEAMAANTASRRVMEKAGLRLVRAFRRPWPDSVNAGEIDAVEYALDKADWPQDRRPDGAVN